MTEADMTQTLMLGDVDIGEYVDRTPISKEQLSAVELKLEELEKNRLPSEEHIYRRLCSESISAEYPLLDLSFLGMNSVIKRPPVVKHKLFGEDIVKNTDIKVPTFSVYRFYGDNKFGVSFEQRGNFRTYFSPEDLPSIIDKNLLKSLEFGDLPYHFEQGRFNSARYESEGVPYDIRQKYGGLELTSEFHGLTPERVKEKVKKSLEHFDENKIFMVTETKPEHWNIQRISSDPLVIGLIGDNCHLIDYFNTTPLEDLVRNNFLDIKKN